MSRKFKNFTPILIGSLILPIILISCSDDEQKQIAQTEHNSFDHSHGTEVSDLKKHKFEHDFAKQCVERETKNSINKDNDKKRFEKPCLCIATKMMKNLTAIEAEKFLVEQKSTQSLKMSFDEAAYFCIQNKEKPKAPSLFGRK
ncbi:MAG: hypothetical protein KAH20_14135 [Methylococcales bacterium]|nr:hypothetical protein [Methylococcales bacterium]